MTKFIILVTIKIAICVSIGWRSAGLI